MRLLKLNNNNKKENWLSWINQSATDYAIYAIFGYNYALYDDRVRLRCQKLESQMYGHNAGNPVIPIY